MSRCKLQSIYKAASRNMMLMVLTTLIVSACTSTSDKQFKLSQENLKSGNYSAAFDHAAQSLDAEIGNKKTQAIFPQIAKSAFDLHLSQIDIQEESKAWDNAVAHYEGMVSMQGEIESIQRALKAYISEQKKISSEDMAAMQAILDLTWPDIKARHLQARNAAAEAHYQRGKSLASADQYRDAVIAFKAALQFVPYYKDAITLAASFKHKADLADALHYYEVGQEAVEKQAYREAAKAFQDSAQYIADFRDARELANRYNHLANEQDAELHYQRGLDQANQAYYRAAAQAFERANSFVNGYRDSINLYRHYTQLANEDDASRYYKRALNALDQDRFYDAANEFRAANRSVPGFRDALDQAQRAEYIIPPSANTVINLVTQEIYDKGIQRRWFGDNSNAKFISTQLIQVRIQNRGSYNRHQGAWPYQIYIEVSGVVEDNVGNQIPISSAAYEAFILYRGHSGNWDADFQHRD